MNISITTPELVRREVLERSARVVNDKLVSDGARAIAARIVALGPDATQDQIAAVGGRSWTINPTTQCDGCGSHVDRAVNIPNGSGGDPAVVCRDCLVAALAALDAAP